MRKFAVGVTLLELMVVLTIAGIAMTAAIPSFQSMIARNRVTTKVNELLLAINLARSEAIRIGGDAFVVATDGSDANDEFGPGWCVVLEDPDCATTTGEVVRVFEPLTGTDTFDSVDNVTQLEFDGLGGMVGTDSLPRRFDLCTDSVPGRRVHITLIGRSKAHGEDDPDVNRQPGC